jgi:hypothetical protein
MPRAPQHHPVSVAALAVLTRQRETLIGAVSSVILPLTWNLRPA